MNLSTIDRVYVLRRAELMQRRLETMLADIKVLIGDLQPPDESAPTRLVRTHASETMIHTGKVLRAVASSMRLIPADLYGGRMFPRACAGRKAAAYALRKLGLTFQQIATALRYKNHTTARRSAKLGRELMIQREFAAAVEAGIAAGKLPVEPVEPVERLAFGQHRDGCTCGICSAGRVDDGAVMQ